MKMEKDVFSNRGYSYSKSQIALFGLVVTSCLGESFNLAGIKLSWILALLTFFIFLKEKMFQKISFLTSDIKVYFCFYILWLIYATFQILFILKNPYALTNYISLLVNLFIVSLLILNIHNRQDIIFINKGLILGFIINLLIGIWELRTGNHIVSLNERSQLYYNDKALGVFGNGNDYATFICFGIISIFLNYSLTKKRLLLSLITIILAVYVLIKVDARAPIYGITLYGISYILIYTLLMFRKSLVFTIINYLLVCVGVVITIIILANNSLESLLLAISSTGNESSDLLRLFLMKEAFNIFWNSALLGVGPGQSIFLLGINVHNFFLEIMSEYGIFIISGIILIFIYLLRSYKWRLPNNMAASIMSFPFAFVLISISSSGANRIRATWILITLLYISVSLYKKKFINRKAEVNLYD